MSKLTILAKFTETLLFIEATLDSFIVTVGDGLVIRLLFDNLVHVELRQWRVFTLSKLDVAVSEVTTTASLTAESFDVVLADVSFEF